MLANVPENFFLVLLLAGFILLVLGVVFGIVMIVRAIVTAKKSGNYSKLKYILASVLCLVVAAMSWLMNFGWVRLIMTMIAIPFVHAVAFFLINLFTVSQMEKSNTLKKFMLLSYLTYLCGYVFLPDGGDIGPMYVFFGLLHGNVIIDFCGLFSGVCFLGNIVLLILQLIETKAVKRNNGYEKWN